MVSIAQTSRKYHGRKAETYDAVREKQRRWKIENETVGRMLSEIKPTSVLDCPVGTGRYLRTYAELGVRAVRGIDASEEMLALARKKAPKKATMISYSYEFGNILELPKDTWHTSVCVRFLDLVDEEAMRGAMRELFRVSKHAIILTVRLGPKYVPKSNTATHDEKKFWSLVRRAKWKVVETVPVLNAGWHIVRLGR